MREFLQSELEFRWPLHLGKCSGNHCDLRLDIQGIPLKWKKKISDKKASIDIYEALPEFDFKKAFVVKTIRNLDSQNALKWTANEVENMRGLCHPHITALLGTFTYQARLNILIFPAACCDLQQFMDRMSGGTSTSDRTTSDYQQLHSSEATSSGQSDHHCDSNDSWPAVLPIERKLEILRGYFVCLSQALSYLHEQGVRHKDIKPANVLIDKSGSVILTDFGISRRFPKDESHVTNNEWKFTRKYASPEIMKDEKMPRDDASDVFSLGCVFLEMATLLLGDTLNGLSEHYSTTVNESAKDDAYHRNLEKVHTWIDHLRTSRGFRHMHGHWVPGENVVSQEISTIEALAGVRQMLDEDPQNRPASKMLWHRFEDISPKKCRDCDPRSPEMWRPSAKQQTAAETGLSNRRSLHAEETERDAIPEADSPMLSPPNVTRQPSPLSRDLRSPVVEDRNVIVSKPDLPRSDFGVDSEGDIIQLPMSPPSRLHFPDEGLGTVRAQFSTAAIHDRLPKTPSGDRSTAKLNPLHQLPTEQPATNPLPLPMDSSSREQQSGVTKHRRFAHHETLVRIREWDMPGPETPIIVYDLSGGIAFQTDCAWLNNAFKSADRSCGIFVLRSYADITPGQDVLCCPLPRVRQKVDIGDTAKFIAKVDLGRLGWRTRMRRWRGRFPRLYVVHYSARSPCTTTGPKA